MKISRYELWQSAKVLTLALILSVGVPYAFAWTGPTASPPANNAPTPINVSATSQTKSGGFWAGSLGSGTICIGSDCRTAWPTFTDTNSGGTITGVTAGSGLSGGGTSGTVTLNNAGVTSVSAGTGISVSGSTGAVTVSAKSGTIVAGCLVANTQAPDTNPWYNITCWGGASDTDGSGYGGSQVTCPSGTTVFNGGSGYDYASSWLVFCIKS